MTLRPAQFQLRARERVLVMDGAMGTLLQARGLPPGSPPEIFNLENPAAVREAHAAYIAAGARIILTNTFGGTRKRLAAYKLASRMKEVNRAAVALAREAASGAEGVWVAGDIGPLGEYLEPIGPVSWDEAYREFYAQARVLAGAGVDLILIETMSDLHEAKAAVMAVRAAFPGPVVVTMTFEQDGRTLTGTPPEVAAVVLAAAGADAVGANCSVGPRDLVPVVRSMAEAVDIPICVQPNAGLPRTKGGRPVYKQTPEMFAAWGPRLVRAGATLIGGCCGTTPDHIKSLSAALAQSRPVSRRRAIRSCLAARTRLVGVGAGAPVIIGDRINPTGRPELARRLAKGDYKFVAAEARAQVEAGAQVIDVNVGGVAGAGAVMAEAVRAVQLAVDVPVSVDAEAEEELTAGLKAAVGKPLLNSCPAIPARMARLLPLAKRWGAAVVGLPLDKGGIPRSTVKVLKLVEMFITRALDTGIALNDIYVDPLMLTAAHRSPAATFAALREIKNTFGVRTILGVSNVSHGLPRRDILNEAAFLFAAGVGLDVALVNPLDERMREAIRAARVLTVGDVANYVRAFGTAPTAKSRRKRCSSQSVGEEVYTAVVEGRRTDAAAATKRLIAAGKSPLTVNEKYVIPALQELGRQFAAKECFLPQLILGAEAAQAALAAMGRSWPRSRRNIGKVLFATVKGDVHDIGKNIVAAVLRSYGFEVKDLGKSVPAERVIAAAKESRPDIVALSALMTTTMPEMEVVAAAMRRARLDIPLMVGGAVVTAAFAKRIGADYAPDAVGAARLARRLVARRADRRNR